MTKEREIEKVRRKGKRFRTSHLEVRYIASLRHSSRGGLIVPRYSHGAVERNRLKRRLREIVRTDVLYNVHRVEFVVRALPSAYRATFYELREQLMRVGTELGANVAS